MVSTARSERTQATLRTAEYISSGIVARHLDINVRLLQRLVQRGFLVPARRTPGGQPRFRLADVALFFVMHGYTGTAVWSGAQLPTTRQVTTPSAAPVLLYRYEAERDDWTLLDINDAAEKIWQIRVRALLGRSARALFSDEPETIEHLAHCTREQSRFRTSAARLLGTMGRRHDAEITYAFMHPNLVLIYIEDLTDTQTAATLATQDRLLRALTEDSTSLVAIIGSDGRIRYASPSYKKSLGIEPSSMIGSTGFDNVHPDDRELWRALFTERVLAGEVGQGSRVRLRRADGAWRWFDIGVTAAQHDPLIDGFVVTSHDVTEHMVVEQRVQASAERYRRIVETAQEGIWQIDPGQRTTFANQRMADLLGYTVDDMMGLPLLAVLRDEDLLRVQQAIEAGKTGLVTASEMQFRRKDGTMIWVSVVGNALVDAAGVYSGAQALVTDITQRKRMEHTLAVADTARAALLYAGDENDLLQRVCADVVAVGGYRLAWIGYLSPGRDSVVHPVARAGLASAYIDEIVVTWDDALTGRGPMGRAIKTGAPQWESDISAAEHYAPWREMALRWGMRASLTFPLVIVGEMVGVLGLYAAEPAAFDEAERAIWQRLATDLSYGIMVRRTEVARRAAQDARRLADERYRHMIEAMHEGVWQVDQQGQTIYLNQRMADMLGYTLGEVSGRTIWDFVLPEDRAVPQEFVTQRHNTQASHQDVRYVRQDGSVFWARLHIEQLTDADGHHMGGLALLTDITARKVMEETQARLAAIVNGSSDAIISVAPDFTVNSWNTAAERLYGYAAEEIVGQPSSMLLMPDSGAEGQMMRATIQRGDHLTLHETVRRHKDGHGVAVSVSISPIVNATGTLVGVASIHRDIAERQRAEAEVRRSAERFQAQYRGNPIPIYTFQMAGDDWQFISCNDAAMTLTHGAIRALVGRYVRDLYRDMPDVVADFARCTSAQTTLRTEWSAPLLSTGDHKDLIVTYVFVPPDLVMVHTEDITERKQVENAVRDGAARMQAIVATAADGIITIDEQGEIESLNQSAERLFGYAEAEARGQNIRLLMPQPYRDEHDDHLARYRSTGEQHIIGNRRDALGQRKDGVVFPLSLAVSEMFIGGRRMFTGIVSDLSRQKEAEARLRQAAKENSLLAAALNNVTSGIIIADATLPEQPIIYANPGFEALTGYAAAFALGRNCRFLQGAETDLRVVAQIRDALRGQRPFLGVLRNYRADGTEFWNELRIALLVDNSGQVTHFVGLQNDVSERVALENALHHQALHDALTDLPNRRLLHDRLEYALARAKRNQRSVAVLMLDLDRFKDVNDTLGHQHGDQVLRDVARCLTSLLRSSDTIGRLGGDEFAIVLPDTDLAAARTISAKIDNELRAGLVVNETVFHVRASIGIAISPDHGTDSPTLLRHADVAMYAAKRGQTPAAVYRSMDGDG